MQPAKVVSTGNSLIQQSVLILDAIYSTHNCIDFITTLQTIEVNLFNGIYENIDSFKHDLLKITQFPEEEIKSIDLTIQKKLPEEYCTTPIYSSVNFKKESLMYAVHIKSHQNLHPSLYDAVKNFNPTIKSPNPPLHRLYISKNEKLMSEARDSIKAALFLFFDVELSPSYNDPNMSHVSATTAVVHPLGDYHVATNDKLDGWMKVKIVQVNNINTRIPNKLAHRLFEKKEQQVRKISLKSATNAESAKENESTRQFMYNIMGLRGDQFQSYDLPIVENILHNTKYTPNNKKEAQPNNYKKSPAVKLLRNGKSTLSSPVSTTTSATTTVTTLPNLYQSASKMLSLLSNNNRPSINKTPDEKPSMEEASKEESTIDEPTANEQPIEKPAIDESDMDESDMDEPNMENSALCPPTIDELAVDEPTIDNETANDKATSGEPSTTDPPIEAPLVARHWRKLEKFCNEKNGDLVPRSKYDAHISRTNDAEGYFKVVYFTPQGDDVIQIFQRSTASQRVIEIACLLTLKDKENIGRIKEIIRDNANTQVIGLTMDRYQMTLKDYLRKHTHNRLTAQQRMQIVVQMLKSIQVIHQLGIAHRDLSFVNFMINVDKVDEPHLYLIDFGKAVFMTPRDAKRWWVNENDLALYQDDVVPESREELAIWCRNLPYVMAKPDHGYRFYRSIQTLPKNNKDRELLPHLIDPAAEDVYSLGTMIWKVFSGIEPWPGVFDTDLKKLRETVNSDFVMDHALDRVMPGPTSKIFLQKFLRVNPLHRESAAEILQWIQQDDIKEGLLEEWALEGSRRLSAKARSATPEPAAAKKAPIVEPRQSSAKARTATPEPAAKKSSSRPIAVPRKAHARNRAIPEPLSKAPVQNVPQLTTERKYYKSGKLMGRPPKPKKTETVKVEPAIKANSGLTNGKPARKRGFVEEKEPPIAEEETSRKTVAKSSRTSKTRSETTPAPKMRRVGFEEKSIIKDQSVKQSSKSGIATRTRSNDVVKTEDLISGMYQKLVDTPKTDHGEPVPVATKKVYPSTYVKTGKPRGRPKKVLRGVPNSNSSVANKDDPQQLNKDEEPSQQLNKIEEPSQQLNKAEEPLQLLIKALEQQINEIEQPLQKMNNTEGTSQPLEKPDTHTIRLPGRPKANLDKQTWELITRGIPTSVREPLRRASSPPSQTEPLFSPQPTSSSGPPSLSPPPQLSSALPQSTLSRQSSQSTFFSLLSPVSNTETVDEAPSPTSPLPSCPPPPEGKKRKMVGETEQENVKRRHTDHQGQEGRSITQHIEANIDEFDRALYTILQNFDLNNSLQ